jgi:hypothetical protein
MVGKESIALLDYPGGSIVNLTDSITRALGGSSAYAPLDALPTQAGRPRSRRNGLHR